MAGQCQKYQICMQDKLHAGQYSLFPFGSKSHFEKMPNTILPLVVLSCLQQLEKYFSRSVITKRLGIGMITESIRGPLGVGA